MLPFAEAAKKPRKGVKVPSKGKMVPGKSMTLSGFGTISLSPKEHDRVLTDTH